MMPTIHCPAHIEFLIRCHVSYDSEFAFENTDSPVHRELIADWLMAGVIQRHEPFGATPMTKGTYKTTALGAAWLQAICNVPLPKAAYLDEQGRVL